MLEVLLMSVSCLAMIKPYEGEVNHGLPGNASEMRFDICNIEQRPADTIVHAETWFKLKQRTCVFGRCVTAWQYSGRVFGDAVLDGDCQIRGLDVRTSPPTPMLDELVPQFEEAAVRRWPEILQQHPEFRQYCER